MRDVIRRAFDDVGEAEIDALCQVAELRHYPADHLLCREGELEHTFYILAEGQVAISQRLADNEDRLLTHLEPGQFFGEMALIDRKPRTASVRTTADASVLEISEEVFNRFLRDSPNMAINMIRHVTANLRSSDQAAIKDLSQKNRELATAYNELKEAQADLVAKERMERELEIAGEVQRNLLPAEFPATPGYTFAGQNVPARHVGGDLYDVIKIDPEHVGVLMADVSDKSVHAALIMAVTRTLFLAHARSSLSPADVALAVHAGLLEVSASDDMFVTAFYGVLHLPTGALQYVRAGQDKPLLFRVEGGPPEPLEADGRFLGMLENLVLEQRRVTLKPGDMLLTYSDGVPDAMNAAIRVVWSAAPGRSDPGPPIRLGRGGLPGHPRRRLRLPRPDRAAFDDITCWSPAARACQPPPRRPRRQHEPAARAPFAARVGRLHPVVAAAVVAAFFVITALILAGLALATRTIPCRALRLRSSSSPRRPRRPPRPPPPSSRRPRRRPTNPPSPPRHRRRARSRVGAYVQVVGTGDAGFLNLRAEPNLDSAVNYLAIEDEVFQVQAGPTNASGFAWWYLVDPATNTRFGWAVQNYLQVVQGLPRLAGVRPCCPAHRDPARPCRAGC